MIVVVASRVTYDFRRLNKKVVVRSFRIVFEEVCPMRSRWHPDAGTFGIKPLGTALPGATTRSRHQHPKRDRRSKVRQC